MNRHIQWAKRTIRKTRYIQKKSSLTSALPYFFYRIYNDALMGEILDINTLNGKNIFETDWDVLIILDACRYDMLKEIEDDSDFAFVDNVEKSVSVGFSTSSWLRHTFTEKYTEEISRTLYVTGNVHSELVFEDYEDTINPKDFLKLDEVWRYAWDNETGTAPPEAVTDRTIRNYRDIKPDRTVVHYMQPHFPSLEYPELASEIQLDRQLKERGAEWKSVWNNLENNDISKDKVWKAYDDNLKYVLDDVRKLINNIDAEKVVITSDHGNAVGELGCYGHSYNIPCTREVPWCITSANNVENYEPELESDIDSGDIDVENRLRALGYKM